MEAADVCSKIKRDDIAFLQYPLIRYSVNYLFIDGNTQACRIASVALK